MTDSLESRLAKAEGTSTTLLSEIRAEARNKPGFLDSVIGFADDTRDEISNGATWILKAEVEDGTQLSEPQLNALVKSLENIKSWQARLHILQIAGRLVVTEQQAQHLFAFAETDGDSSRPFLRAWSLDARVCLAHDFAAFKPAALRALEDAQKDQAASVRARARNLAAKLD